MNIRLLIVSITLVFAASPLCAMKRRNSQEDIKRIKQFNIIGQEWLADRVLSKKPELLAHIHDAHEKQNPWSLLVFLVSLYKANPLDDCIRLIQLCLDECRTSLVELKDADGATVVHLAIRWLYKDVVEFLLQVPSFHYEVCDLIMEKDNNGDSALDVARTIGKVRIADLLQGHLDSSDYVARIANLSL